MYNSNAQSKIPNNMQVVTVGNLNFRLIERNLKKFKVVLVYEMFSVAALYHS
jgi:hypothetical protein